ncbi:MAG: sensor histidine kinase, partial [Syntrophales bacterium]
EALVAERTRELVKANKDLGKANKRLLELGKVKDDFLGMISHELRTPANGMVGIGELIIDMCSASAECTLYSDLFRESSLRMRNLIEDATMIADIEKAPISGRAAISFSDLLENVRTSLKEISITLVREGVMEPVFLQGDPSLLKKAMETLILLATAFSRDKHKAQITGAVEALLVCVRLAVDDLSLTEEQAADFFEIESTARGSSTAEILGLAPVVADKIIAAFGGKISLVKGEGKTGFLEAILIREQGRAGQD